MTAQILALALLAMPSWMERLWKKPEPHIDASFEKLRKGDAPAAVELMEKASPGLEEPVDKSALAYDKSAALLMIGKQGAPLAADEAKRALEGPCGPLCAVSSYNLGFAYADQGKRDEAIDAYGKSLTLDPTDDDAKHNLELLLREKKEPQAGGQSDDKKDQKPEDKKDEQQSKGKDEEQKKQKPEDKKDAQDKQGEQKQSQGKPQQDKQEQKPDDKQGEQKQSQGQEQKDQEQRRREQEQQQAQGRKVDRTEAQRLLDALRANEKNLQVWRFGQRPDKPRRTRDAEKDW